MQDPVFLTHLFTRALEPASHSYAAGRTLNPEATVLSKSRFMKRIILATALVALAATSGQAFARSGGVVAPRQEAVVDQRAYDALNAFDQDMAPQMTDADRYHGGPKSND
jgi:hypothetical protein